MHTGHLFMRSWWVLALRGLAAIAFGAITLAWPGVTVLSLLMVFAAYALLGGGASVVGAFSNRKHGGDWWALLLLGICGLAVGILTILNPLLTTFALIVMIGVNALISGVFGNTTCVFSRNPKASARSINGTSFIALTVPGNARSVMVMNWFLKSICPLNNVAFL